MLPDAFLLKLAAVIFIQFLFNVVFIIHIIYQDKTNKKASKLADTRHETQLKINENLWNHMHSPHD